VLVLKAETLKISTNLMSYTLTISLTVIISQQSCHLHLRSFNNQINHRLHLSITQILIFLVFQVTNRGKIIMSGSPLMAINMGNSLRRLLDSLQMSNSHLLEINLMYLNLKICSFNQVPSKLTVMILKKLLSQSRSNNRK
jgi:hypothetical protein